MTSAAVYGTGSWGTAFASVLADAGTSVTMWGRRDEVVAQINDGVNKDYLPELRLPSTIRATTDPAEAVGSALLGQAPADGLFAGRPSVAGEGWDPLNTYGSNLGPESPALLAAVEERRAVVAAREGIDPADVPPDALTASASGLDPHISPAYAALQVDRVAAAHDLSPLWSNLEKNSPTEEPSFRGFFGPDHHRFEMVFSEVTRDAADPALYHVMLY